jgi:AAA domain
MSKIDDSDFEYLSSIETEQIEWLWDPLIPQSMITIIEGDPGLGKSFLAMHIGAQTTVGGALPGVRHVKRGRVLYFTAEDDPAYTIRPRIDAMKGDPSMIRLQSRYSPFDDDGLKILWREVRAHPPSLIIIDPLVAYVPGSADFYKPNEIRALLYKLNEVAVYSGAALVIIRHLTKGKREKALYQGVGSIDVIGVARSAIRVAEHPEDPDLRVVAHLKHNLTKRGDSWLFSLDEQRGGVPILRWHGNSPLTADDLSELPREDVSPRDEAIELLTRELKKGPKTANELKEIAEKYSISVRTLNRAKSELGVASRKIGNQWSWELPGNRMVRVNFGNAKKPS